MNPNEEHLIDLDEGVAIYDNKKKEIKIKNIKGDIVLDDFTLEFFGKINKAIKED